MAKGTGEEEKAGAALRQRQTAQDARSEDFARLENHSAAKDTHRIARAAAQLRHVDGASLYKSRQPLVSVASPTATTVGA